MAIGRGETKVCEHMMRNLPQTPGAGDDSHEADQYPHDYLHSDRPYPETQSDIGVILIVGAITLIALMALLAVGVI